MLILALETSCDDTAVALVRNGTEVIHTKTVGQTAAHQPWGGVVPEIAARLHSERWAGAVRACMNEANVTHNDIDAIAVTQGPGLQTSLLTGCTAGMVLSQEWHKPLIPVHHVHGHIVSCRLGRTTEEIQLPALVLTVSGGHTQMHIMRSFMDITKIGETLDDAAGEAYDKASKMLGLGYPGGPIVEKMAAMGDKNAYDLPRMLMQKDSLDFSFSGLKAAVYRILEQTDEITEAIQQNICASFQYRVETVFTEKVRRALALYPEIQQVHFVGGVSANRGIRQALQKFLDMQKKELLYPTEFLYCTDNAAMIASSAQILVDHYGVEKYKVKALSPMPRWDIQMGVRGSK